MAIKNTVSSDFDPRSSIVKSVFDCRLPGVIRYKLACTYSEYSNQSAHQSVSFPHEDTLNPWLPIERPSKTLTSPECLMGPPVNEFILLATVLRSVCSISCTQEPR